MNGLTRQQRRAAARAAAKQAERAMDINEVTSPDTDEEPTQLLAAVPSDDESLNQEHPSEPGVIEDRPEPPAAEPGQAPDGVWVLVEYGDGSPQSPAFKIRDVIATGTTRPSEVPFILEMGEKLFKQNTLGPPR